MSESQGPGYIVRTDTESGCSRAARKALIVSCAASATAVAPFACSAVEQRVGLRCASHAILVATLRLFSGACIPFRLPSSTSSRTGPRFLRVSPPDACTTRSGMSASSSPGAAARNRANSWSTCQLLSACRQHGALAACTVIHKRLCCRGNLKQRSLDNVGRFCVRPRGPHLVEFAAADPAQAMLALF